MNNKTTSNYGITFNTAGDAVLAQKDLLIIAKAYGSASLAEFKDILKIKPTYEDNKIRWTDSEIDTARIKVDKSGMFSIRFPVHNETHEDTSLEEDDIEDESTHAVYVNVTTTEMNNPADILEVVFDQIDKFRDRDIFLNIY